jgi:hypothetical protein
MSSIDSIVASSAVQTSIAPPADPLREALGQYEATGRLDIQPFTEAAPEALLGVLSGLAPQQRGTLERLLGEQGLLGKDGLVGGTVGAVGETVARTTDAAVETPTEKEFAQTSERIEDSRLDQRLGQLRGQADLDFVLAPFSKLDRPPAELAASTTVAGALEDDRRP